MPVPSILLTAKIYKTEKDGHRLIFKDCPVNPRDQLGKVGVRISEHASVLTNFHIKASILIEDNEGGIKRETVYLHRKSLYKYLRACYPFEVINKDASHKRLLRKLNQLSSPDTKKEKDNAQGLQLRHAGEPSKRLLNRGKHEFHDKNRAKFYGAMYQHTIASTSQVKARLAASSEKKLFKQSELLAKRRFNEAYKKVSAFKDHINLNDDFNTLINPSLGDIPETTKENYINPNAYDIARLHVNGKLPKHAKVDTSTGTSGKPTVWVRGEKEIETVIKSFCLASKIEYGTRNLNYINCFALGPWATGMTVYEIMRRTGTVFASGPDKEKIIERLEEIYAYEENQLKHAVSKFLIKQNGKLNQFKNELVSVIHKLVYAMLDDKAVEIEKLFDTIIEKDFLSQPKFIQQTFIDYKKDILKIVHALNKDKTQIIIAGYPPFLSDLVDYARDKKIDFSKFHVHGIVGGQEISENLRQKLIAEGFGKIRSTYGASDTDIFLGLESDFEVKLRQEIEKNSALAHELYGDGMGLPMIFHYDPLNYHISVNKQNELIFTCVRNDRSSPVVSRNLGDTGRVYASSDIQAILLKHGIHLTPNTNFPLLFVWGRDAAVNYRGAKVTFNELESSLLKIDTNHIFTKRAFYKTTENDIAGFEIWLELKEGLTLPISAHAQDFLKKLLFEMANNNQDLKYHFLQLDEAKLPKLRIFKHGQSPIIDANGHRKQILVYNDHNVTPQEIFRNGGKDMCVGEIKKDKKFLSDLKSLETSEKIIKPYSENPSLLLAIPKAEEKEKSLRNNRTLKL